jgi:hypothetical protein
VRRLNHRPRPKRAFDIVEDLGVKLLATKPRSFEPLHDLRHEGGGQALPPGDAPHEAPEQYGVVAGGQGVVDVVEVHLELAGAVLRDDRPGGHALLRRRGLYLGEEAIQVVQILYRNDTEVDCSTQELIDWDAAIIAEDRDALESTDPDAIVEDLRGRVAAGRYPAGDVVPAGVVPAGAAAAGVALAGAFDPCACPFIAPAAG